MSQNLLLILQKPPSCKVVPVVGRGEEPSCTFPSAIRRPPVNVLVPSKLSCPDPVFTIRPSPVILPVRASEPDATLNVMEPFEATLVGPVCALILLKVTSCEEIFFIGLHSLINVVIVPDVPGFNSSALFASIFKCPEWS